MSASDAYGGPNRLLQSMEPSDFSLLEPHFRSVSLTFRQPLEVADELPRDLYFLEGSVASVVATLRSGQNFEVGLIGWDGMTGTSMLAEAPSPFDCYVQFIGPALSLPAKVLLDALNQSPTLRATLNLYAHMLSVQTAYTALAGAHSPIPERLARWILMVEDRVDGSSFGVTHELLAIMLGVRRSGVTHALHVLEGEHLIKSTRGRMNVLDREGLLTLAGSAYGKTERSYDELIKVSGVSETFRLFSKTHTSR